MIIFNINLFFSSNVATIYLYKKVIYQEQILFEGLKFPKTFQHILQFQQSLITDCIFGMLHKP